ncbi:MAG: ABC transporter permease [Proteobacteria bacterium]|nr:ABC transporter permease [Pseudomonadota bacterium]
MHPFAQSPKRIRLTLQLAMRDIEARYRGSALGLIWSLLLPLSLLALYTFVFGIVMKVRWQGSGDGTHAFALTLFTGLILHQFASECLIRAPRLMIDNASFVKKVVFPLEILPASALLAAAFQYLVGLTVLLAGVAFTTGGLQPTALLIPIVFLPFALMLLGAMWALAALGTYVRDISHGMGLALTLMLFFSTVFYPAASLPERIRPYIYLNPLSYATDAARSLILQGTLPDTHGILVFYLIGVVTSLFGYGIFTKLKCGFAEAV